MTLGQFKRLERKPFSGNKFTVLKIESRILHAVEQFGYFSALAWLCLVGCHLERELRKEVAGKTTP